jgi:hypothetical protein
VAVVQYTYTHKQYRKRHKTNNTKNTKIHRTTQKIHRATQKLGRMRAALLLFGFYPGICLTTEKKARKNLSQGSHYALGFSSATINKPKDSNKSTNQMQQFHKSII